MGAKAKASGVKDFIFGVRPEDITKQGTGEATATMSEPVPAHVNVIETLGKETYLDITTGDDNITAIISPNIAVKMDEDIDLEINMDKVHLFKKEDGQAIF
jgi:multiple sugar transport system ATP-binding protein